MAGFGMLSIPETVAAVKLNKTPEGITPLQWADKLDSLAENVLPFVADQHKKEGTISVSYDELIYDLDAWANMGKYYASKIRAAYYLHAFRESKGDNNKQLAIAELKQALINWKAYVAAATRNYKPQFMAKTRTIDWDVLTVDVENEIKTVKEL